MRTLIGLIAMVVQLVVCGTAVANDSFAAIGAGGIVLKRSNDIVMEYENLFLSADKVKVHYIFSNPTDHDVTSVVVFPLPKMEEDEYQGVGVDPDAPNPLDFKVSVNSKPVPVKIERKKLPNNAVQLSYYWEQTFPKKQELEIEHSYTPMMGGFYFMKESPMSDEDIKAYCVSRDLQTTLSKTLSRGKMIFARTLDYILSTGGHWNGPIRDFHLTIDKGKTDNSISLCMDGVQRTGNTQFKVHKTNFTPKSDLKILFLNNESPQ